MSLLNETIDKIKSKDTTAEGIAKARLDKLTMPHWALGRLMDLAVDLAGMTGTNPPPVARKTIITMAGDHGVCAEGVSKYPQEVTPQMVMNFVAGGAGVNALAKLAGANVVVVDMGVIGDFSKIGGGKVVDKKIAEGTANIAQGPAMSLEDAVRSVEAGIEIALEYAGSTDIFGTGDMGIGNTTPSSAIVSVITGKPPQEVTGRGTGVDDGQLEQKIAVIDKILEVNKPDKSDGLDILSKIGGFEIGGIAGVILGAASMRKPVIVDGFISTAGALIAALLAPASKDYMVASHHSVEPGHTAMLDVLGKKAYLNLEMRLGEGTGAAMAMGLVDAAVAVLTDVATFEEAAVSGADK